MDYTELKKTIKAYVENDFPDTVGDDSLTSTEQLNTFIKQAEQRIYNTAQLLDFRKNVTGQTTAANKYLSVPVDWRANFSLAVIDTTTGAYDYLLNKDVNFIREAFPYPSTTGKPTHYALFDRDSYILGPTPDAVYSMELHYFYYPTSIVVAGESWLGANFDFVLLYGALIEANIFMKGEDSVNAEYKANYNDGLAMLKQHAEGKNRQDMYRTQQVRYPVR